MNTYGDLAHGLIKIRGSGGGLKSQYTCVFGCASGAAAGHKPCFIFYYSTSSEAARLAAGKSKGKLVMAAAASPAQPHRGEPLILNFVLNECFNSFTKFPVHKWAKNAWFWTRFWTNFLSTHFWTLFWRHQAIRKLQTERQFAIQVVGRQKKYEFSEGSRSNGIPGTLWNCRKTWFSTKFKD